MHQLPRPATLQHRADSLARSPHENTEKTLSSAGDVMSRLVLRFLVVSCCSVLVPTLVSAQSLAGVVRDDSGAVLPGVMVEAASPTLIEKVRAATTDGSGQYRIPDLSPGLYKVTYT